MISPIYENKYSITDHNKDINGIEEFYLTGIDKEGIAVC